MRLNLLLVVSIFCFFNEGNNQNVTNMDKILLGNKFLSMEVISCLKENQKPMFDAVDSCRQESMGNRGFEEFLQRCRYQFFFDKVAPCISEERAKRKTNYPDICVAEFLKKNHLIFWGAKLGPKQYDCVMAKINSSMKNIIKDCEQICFPNATKYEILSAMKLFKNNIKDPKLIQFSSCVFKGNLKDVQDGLKAFVPVKDCIPRSLDIKSLVLLFPQDFIKFACPRHHRLASYIDCLSRIREVELAKAFERCQSQSANVSNSREFAKKVCSDKPLLINYLKCLDQTMKEKNGSKIKQYCDKKTGVAIKMNVWSAACHRQGKNRKIQELLMCIKQKGNQKEVQTFDKCREESLSGSTIESFTKKVCTYENQCKNKFTECYIREKKADNSIKIPKECMTDFFRPTPSSWNFICKGKPDNYQCLLTKSEEKLKTLLENCQKTHLGENIQEFQKSVCSIPPQNNDKWKKFTECTRSSFKKESALIPAYYQLLWDCSYSSSATSNARTKPPPMQAQ